MTDDLRTFQQQRDLDPLTPLETDVAREMQDHWGPIHHRPTGTYRCGCGVVLTHDHARQQYEMRYHLARVVVARMLAAAREDADQRVAAALKAADADGPLVWAVAQALMARMDDELKWGVSVAEDAGKAGGYVLRDDPRNLACDAVQAVAAALSPAGDAPGEASR